MHIIVATALNAGSAEYKNMGDVAMLQMAVERLRGLWPDAQIDVLTDSPSNLQRYCPGARPLSRAGSQCWVDDRILAGRFNENVPGWAWARLGAAKRMVGRHWPAAVELLIRLRLSLRDSRGRGADFKAFLHGLKNCDLLVVCGAGGFADSCREWNLWILGTMDAAMARRTPVVMMGQGMGPLSDPEARARAASVLPKVNLIALRGSSGGVELLESLGVDAAKVLTTGDEAIELAWRERALELGSAVGVNLRVASYAGVGANASECVGAVLGEFARLHRIPLLPIPIAFHEYANDHDTIRELLAGRDEETDGGQLLDSPRALIEQTARCRIVVTGAYHAAVFALAQGIPAVCLSNSVYYQSKFDGLVDLFGNGCAIVELSGPDLRGRLAMAIQRAWDSAQDLRSPLLESARWQVEWSRGAYQHVKSLLQPDTGGEPALIGSGVTGAA